VKKKLILIWLLLTMLIPVNAEQISDYEAQNLIKDSLSDQGLLDITTKIIDQSLGVRALLIIYRSSATSIYGIGEDIGLILTSFLAITYDGWDCDELSVVVEDQFGNSVGSWFCTKEWKEAHLQNRMSKEDLIANVISTFVPS